MERNYGIPTHLGVAAFFFGIATGANLVNIADGSSEDKADKRVKNVQRYNGELQQQLEVGDRLVAHLTVDDAGKHFSFETRTTSGIPEQCDGDYQLRKNVATISGDLSCSQHVKVGG